MAKRPLLRGNWVNPAAAFLLSLILSADFYATRAFGEGEGASAPQPPRVRSRPRRRLNRPKKAPEEVKKPAEEAAKEKPEVTREASRAPAAESKPAPAKPVEVRGARESQRIKRDQSSGQSRETERPLSQKPTRPATWRCARPRLTPFTRSAGSARISAISGSSPRSRRGNMRCRRMRSSACSSALSTGRARRQARADDGQRPRSSDLAVPVCDERQAGKRRA